MNLRIDTPWVPAWQPEFVGTLLFLLRTSNSGEDEVLLIHKKTGHGAGRINAPGGKLEPGEAVVDGAVREVFEEVGLRVEQPRIGAEMHFVECNGPQWLGFALTSRVFSGELIETHEAKPFWCAVSQIPYDRMWPDDAIWLPQVLARSSHQAGAEDILVWDFLFDNERLLEHQVVHDSVSNWSHFGAERAL